MKTLTIFPDNPNERHIAEAARALEQGEIIVYPTDTLYALGCDALNPKAIERLCRLKGLNPDKNLLSVVCSDLSMASDYARIDNPAFRLLKEYLPGPYTFILRASTTLPKVFKGRKSVGIRVPDNSIARAVAAELGHPILSTSVPDDDDHSVCSPDAVELLYEDNNLVTLMINGGEGGIEPSTIVDITDTDNPQILRQGIGIFE